MSESSDNRSFQRTNVSRKKISEMPDRPSRRARAASVLLFCGVFPSLSPSFAMSPQQAVASSPAVASSSPRRHKEEADEGRGEEEVGTAIKAPAARKRSDQTEPPLTDKFLSLVSPDGIKHVGAVCMIWGIAGMCRAVRWHIKDDFVDHLPSIWPDLEVWYEAVLKTSG